MNTLTNVIRNSFEKVRNCKKINKKIDVFLMIQLAINTSFVEIINFPTRKITIREKNKIDSYLERYISGESVHRILGKRSFYGLDFILSSNIFEPRPETETLIEIIIPFLCYQSSLKSYINCLDIGTGSGAIAITLLSIFPKLYATGIDIEQKIIKIAKLNAKLANVQDRFCCFYSDCFQFVKEKYDLIISNPPYVPTKEIQNLDVTVRNFDPLLALDGGLDGLSYYRILSKNSKLYLKPFGRIVVEIGYQQKENVIKIFTNNNYQLQEIRSDISGINRALMFIKKNNFF